MKNRCEDIQDLLIDYAYGEIKQGQACEDAVCHIKECKECSAKVADIKKIAKAAAKMKVDFSDEVWDMHRHGIISKLEKEEMAATEKVARRVRPFFDIKKAAVGFALLFLLSAGFGVTYYKAGKMEQAERHRAITQKIELYENLEIIERLDFYKQISKAGVEL